MLTLLASVLLFTALRVEVISNKEPTVCQVPGSALDSKLMEGITYTEVSLDSRPMEGSSCQEPVDQSILLSSWTVSPRKCITRCVNSPRLSTVKPEIVNRMKDSREVNMTLPESAPPTRDPNVSMKNPPENLTPMSTPMTALAWPCVNSPQLPTVKPEIINRMKDSREVNMTLPSLRR